MRQQLIQWFVDDITPRIKESRNPSGEIIKFATEKNLPAELVRSLGQIHNSAKTVAWLDKHAGSRRGADFPLVDVDAMTDKYLEVRPKDKEARKNEWTTGPAPEQEQSLVWAFAQDETPEPISQHSGTNFISNPDIRKAAAAKEDAKLLKALAEEAEFDIGMKRIKCASEIERCLREHPHIDFTKLSADLLAMYGDGFRPEVEHLERLLCSRNWIVKAADAASPPDLFDYPADLMINIDAFRELGFEAEAAREIIKEASATMEPPATEAEFAEATRKKKVHDEEEDQADPKTQAGAGSRQNSGQSSKGSRPSNNQAPQAGGGGGNPGGGKKGPGGTPGYFDTTNSWLDAIAQKHVPNALTFAQKNLLGNPGGDQMMVDRQFADAKHMALLQRLLTTDEVLSTADPEKVVEIYNTVRENSPDLAADPNVMRVFLRSAIQHDGISPFDLKNLLDTQISRHKVDAGLKAQTSVGKPKEVALPKPVKDE